MGDDQNSPFGPSVNNNICYDANNINQPIITVFNVKKLKVTDGNKHNCLDL